jgi:hypothetical protein
MSKTFQTVRNLGKSDPQLFRNPCHFAGGSHVVTLAPWTNLGLAGGGLNHCGAFGVTDEFSKEIVEHPVSIPDFHATIYHALGIDPSDYLYDGDRPVPITDGGSAIRALFG